MKDDLALKSDDGVIPIHNKCVDSAWQNWEREIAKRGKFFQFVQAASAGWQEHVSVLCLYSAKKIGMILDVFSKQYTGIAMVSP